MKTKLILSIALLSFSSLSLANTLTSMNSEQTKSTFSDKTITTVAAVTLNGNVIDNTFTGYFSKDGTMTGKFANPTTNGTPQTDKGTWRVQANGDFCFTWENWDNGKERCVTFYKLANAVLVVGAGNKFETLILNNNIQSGNQMSDNSVET